MEVYSLLDTEPDPQKKKKITTVQLSQTSREKKTTIYRRAKEKLI